MVASRAATPYSTKWKSLNWKKETKYKQQLESPNCKFVT